MGSDPPPDTWWSIFRWNLAMAIVSRAMWIAPPGTARERWCAHHNEWGRECLAAWKARYPNGRT